MARYVSEWLNKPKRPAGMTRQQLEAIVRRRRQMLIHSYLYYGADTHIIDDHTWTKWAQQLQRLQAKYGWKVGFYDAVFKDWNGSTGHHLPMNDHNVIRVAERLLGHDEELQTKASRARMTKVLAYYRRQWAAEDPLT